MPRVNNREKTNSVTHLVKIIADESVEEALSSRRIMTKETTECLVLDNLQPIKNVVKIMQLRLGNIERQLAPCLDQQPDIDAAPEDWNKPSAGAPWSQDEECELQRNFAKAVAWMANKHGRTDTAIRCRLRDMIRKGSIHLS